MKSNTQGFELGPVQMWIARLRARIAMRKPVRLHRPTITAPLRVPKASR